jgi:hypothetical protein
VKLCKFNGEILQKQKHERVTTKLRNATENKFCLHIYLFSMVYDQIAMAAWFVMRFYMIAQNAVTKPTAEMQSHISVRPKRPGVMSQGIQLSVFDARLAHSTMCL